MVLILLGNPSSSTPDNPNQAPPSGKLGTNYYAYDIAKLAMVNLINLWVDGSADA